MTTHSCCDVRRSVSLWWSETPGGMQPPGVRSTVRALERTDDQCGCNIAHRLVLSTPNPAWTRILALDTSIHATSRTNRRAGEVAVMNNHPMIKAIETSYKGYRFRSRTEARWAVFFDVIGLNYEYEKEGYPLPSGPYLPDFWLPGIGSMQKGRTGCWLEVKGVPPSEVELRLAWELSAATGNEVFIAVGAPSPSPQVVYIHRDHETAADHLYSFCEDRRNPMEYWLYGKLNEWTPMGFSIGPVDGPDHWRDPIIGELMMKAYDAARSARFGEHGGVNGAV